MTLDPVFLARIQFAFTVGFHFIFPALTVGLALLLAAFETLALRKGGDAYAELGRRFGKLFAITFVVGVATGITMEFQFGTNWAQYSRFVGDIFGAPLAAEALLAFFVESTFLGLYMFGRGRISKRLQWFSALMVACGATMSAFWIIVANSWQQTPAGYVFNPATGRAELTSFLEAVFNPSTLIRFFHTVDALLICGCFSVAGVAAYWLLRDKDSLVARKALRLAMIVGFIASVLELFPFGHEHARQVGIRQPEKLAAFEGLFEGGPNAPLTVMGIPTNDRIIGAVRIPYLLSMLVHFRPSGIVHGLNEYPPEERPPVVLPFTAFHVMVYLGMLFILVTAFGTYRLRGGRLYGDTWFLRLLILAIPLPVIASEAGWVVAEVGRQPWIVYHLLRTKDAVSTSVSSGEILFSLILFLAIYALLFALYVYLICRTVKEAATKSEAMTSALQSVPKSKI